MGILNIAKLGHVATTLHLLPHALNAVSMSSTFRVHKILGMVDREVCVPFLIKVHMTFPTITVDDGPDGYIFLEHCC